MLGLGVACDVCAKVTRAQRPTGPLHAPDDSPDSVARVPIGVFIREIDRLLTVRDADFPTRFFLFSRDRRASVEPDRAETLGRGVTVNDARARPSILDDVAVRAARDGARLQGDGRGQDPGPPRGEYYNATMAKNAEYVVKDPAAVDKLGRQLVFSNLAKCVRPRFARASRPSHRDRLPRRDARATPRGSRRGPRRTEPPTVLPTWTHLAFHAWLTSPPLTPPSTGFPAW